MQTQDNGVRERSEKQVGDKGAQRKRQYKNS